MIPFVENQFGNLPCGRLRYIESTGTQYINTGIKPDFANGDSIEIHFYGAAFSGAAPCTFGSRESGVRNGIYLLGLNNLTVCDAAGYSFVSLPKQAPNELFLTVNDSTVAADSQSYTMPRRVTCGLPIYLFALNNYGTGTFGIYNGMKLYEWKYWHNGTLMQHLLPATDNNSVPCLYDLITGNYYYNAGTGTFNYA